MTPQGLDPRGPRFGAGITSILMLVVIYMSLDSASSNQGWFAISPLSGSVFSPETNLHYPALYVMLFAFAMFIFGTVLGPARHPYSYLYKATLRKALKEPSSLEDPRPVRFAQLIGLIVTGSGAALYLLGIPLALPIAAAIAFVAAFLNSVFAFCLGCQMYIGLKRLGVIR